MKQLLKIIVLTAFATLFNLQSAVAQLPDDVRDVFKGLVKDLDADLAEKLQDAIANDTATVEFTPEQFRRFRADPVNPFDGLDGIHAPDGGGNIA